MVKSQFDSSPYSNFCISDCYNGLVKGEECFAIFVLNFSVVPRKWRGEFYGSNGRISAVRAMMSSAFTKSVLCFLMISSISF